MDVLKGDFIGEATKALKNLLGGKLDQIFSPKML